MKISRIYEIKDLFRRYGLEIFAHSQKKKDNILRLKIHFKGKDIKDFSFIENILKRWYTCESFEWKREEPHYIGTILVPLCYTLILKIVASTT